MYFCLYLGDSKTSLVGNNDTTQISEPKATPDPPKDPPQRVKTPPIVTKPPPSKSPAVSKTPLKSSPPSKNTPGQKLQTGRTPVKTKSEITQKPVAIMPSRKGDRERSTNSIATSKFSVPGQQKKPVETQPVSQEKKPAVGAVKKTLDTNTLDRYVYTT